MTISEAEGLVREMDLLLAWKVAEMVDRSPTVRAAFMQYVSEENLKKPVRARRSRIV